MKRRGFLASLIGGGAAAVTAPVAVFAAPSVNPLDGQKTAYVRVTKPTKTGDRIFCSVGSDGQIDGWIAASGEPVHAVSMMDANFAYADTPLVGMIPYYQTIAVRVIRK